LLIRNESVHGAHLPEEAVQKLVEETADVCAKRDRAAFEADSKERA